MELKEGTCDKKGLVELHNIIHIIVKHILKTNYKTRKY